MAHVPGASAGSQSTEFKPTGRVGAGHGPVPGENLLYLTESVMENASSRLPSKGSAASQRANVGASDIVSSHRAL